MNKLFLYTILFFSVTFSTAFAEKPWHGIRNNEGMLLYSSMGFIKEEGEYSGLQIAIMPYNPYYDHFKYKVLWRSGSGYLDVPLLLDATRQGDILKITLPKRSLEQGEWTLTLHDDSLFAEGPLGHRYKLQRIGFSPEPTH